MSFFKRLALAALLLGGTAGALSACQSLAGIEDRTFDGEAAPSAQCRAYCDVALSNCVGMNALYSGSATCLATCKLTPEGNDLEPGGNTIACRFGQLTAAEFNPRH